MEMNRRKNANRRKKMWVKKIKAKRNLQKSQKWQIIGISEDSLSDHTL
jgi:DNA-binding Xre family transcriptional regulator